MKVLAPSALLPEGWANEVLIEIEGGAITGVKPNARDLAAERLRGAVVPGMSNAHSHAFQRAMAGLTERAGLREKVGLPRDDFWSWRELMYRFLLHLTPEDVEAIATELYIEMLKAGYTSVAEFHYIHNDPQGKPYAHAAMALHILNAAFSSGIRLTLLPVFYAHSNFGGEAPTANQRRFIQSPQSFIEMLHALHSTIPPENAYKSLDDLVPALHGETAGKLEVSVRRNRRLGIAPHSLRAVTPAELKLIVETFSALDPHAPIHIHVAEQQREVEHCLEWSGRRPVEWLLDEMEIDQRWCLVHCTHVTLSEIQGLARSKAVVALCPSTEANLGDGIFPLLDYWSSDGRFAIGGDSHVAVDPFAELRLLEYLQRLQAKRRNLLAPEGESVGATLYRAALRGGSQALGQETGALAPGMRADLLVLNEQDPALLQQDKDTLLDGAIFGPCRMPVRDVMVDGQWLVREGHHPHEERASERFRETLARLLTC